MVIGGMKINKLNGFYELKKLGVPSVKWEKYTTDTKFDNDKLWTVRVAVQKGNDMNLPRAVGVSAKEAKKFAEKISKKLNDNDLIIYYPYFIAEKSGIMKISQSRYVIEAVEKDLWNLATDGRRDQTIIIKNDVIEKYGEKELLNDKEIEELKKEGRKVKGKFRNDLIQGRSVLMEWSLAVETDSTGQKKGEPYLVFYECRTIR